MGLSDLVCYWITAFAIAALIVFVLPRNWVRLIKGEEPKDLAERLTGIVKEMEDIIGEGIENKTTLSGAGITNKEKEIAFNIIVKFIEAIKKSGIAQKDNTIYTERAVLSLFRNFNEWYAFYGGIKILLIKDMHLCQYSILYSGNEDSISKFVDHFINRGLLEDFENHIKEKQGDLIAREKNVFAAEEKIKRLETLTNI